MKQIAIVGGCGHVGFPLGLALAKGLHKILTGGGGCCIVNRHKH